MSEDKRSRRATQNWPKLNKIFIEEHESDPDVRRIIHQYLASYEQRTNIYGKYAQRNIESLLMKLEAPKTKEERIASWKSHIANLEAMPRKTQEPIRGRSDKMRLDNYRTHVLQYLSTHKREAQEMLAVIRQPNGYNSTAMREFNTILYDTFLLAYPEYNTCDKKIFFTWRQRCKKASTTALLEEYLGFTDSADSADVACHGSLSNLAAAAAAIARQDLSMSMSVDDQLVQGMSEKAAPHEETAEDKTNYDTLFDKEAGHGSPHQHVWEGSAAVGGDEVNEGSEGTVAADENQALEARHGSSNGAEAAGDEVDERATRLNQDSNTSTMDCNDVTVGALVDGGSSAGSSALDDGGSSAGGGKNPALEDDDNSGVDYLDSGGGENLPLEAPEAGDADQDPAVLSEQCVPAMVLDTVLDSVERQAEAVFRSAADASLFEPMEDIWQGQDGALFGGGGGFNLPLTKRNITLEPETIPNDFQVPRDACKLSFAQTLPGSNKRDLGRLSPKETKKRGRHSRCYRGGCGDGCEDCNGSAASGGIGDELPIPAHGLSRGTSLLDDSMLNPPPLAGAGTDARRSRRPQLHGCDGRGRGDVSCSAAGVVFKASADVGLAAGADAASAVRKATDGEGCGSAVATTGAVFKASTDVVVNLVNSDDDSTVGAASGGGSGGGQRYQILLRVGFLFKRVSSNANGTCGGCGVSGSIGPTGMLRIFDASDLQGRSIADFGGGNGRVLMEAALCGASNGWGLELSENKGNFAIFNAALCKMADDEYLRNCKTGFDLNGALRAGDIDKVAYV